jgi:hypothetical protein
VQHEIIDPFFQNFGGKNADNFLEIFHLSASQRPLAAHGSISDPGDLSIFNREFRAGLSGLTSAVNVHWLVLV